MKGHKTTRAFFACLAALFTFVVAACGSTAPSTQDRANGQTQGKEITVKGYRGEETTLSKPAERLVTLEWRETEIAASLGLSPVGVADPKGFAAWDTAVTLDPNVPDVGKRTEPSLEAIAKTSPDLIVGMEDSIPPAALEQMKKIAPVLIVEGANTDDPMANLESAVTAIATATGKEAKGKELLDTMNKTIESNKAKVKAGSKYVLSYPSANGNTVEFRLHGPNSFPDLVAARMGLANAWTESGDKAYGIGNADLERMSKLPEDTTVLMWFNKDEAEATDTVLPRNALWNSIPFVKKGNAKKFGDGVWMYGGPASMAQLSDSFAEVFSR